MSAHLSGNYHFLCFYTWRSIYASVLNFLFLFSATNIKSEFIIYSSAAETLNTLKFAQRAKLIQNNVSFVACTDEIKLLSVLMNRALTSGLDIFFMTQAIINEDLSGDVAALKHQIQLLKVKLASYGFNSTEIGLEKSTTELVICYWDRRSCLLSNGKG